MHDLLRHVKINTFNTVSHIYSYAINSAPNCQGKYIILKLMTNAVIACSDCMQWQF